MSRHASKEDRLVSSIYDAAVDEKLLADALVNLADATNCPMASLEVYAPASACFIGGRNPFLPPDYRESYLTYWYNRVSSRKSTDHFPVGHIIHSREIWEKDAWNTDAFLNDWVKPQGLGGDARWANLAVSGRATVVVGVIKPTKIKEFLPSDERLFAVALPHFIRSVAIHRRLRMAETHQIAVGESAAPAGFLIVDERGRILAGHGPTRQRLHSAGLLFAARDEGRIESANPALERLIRGAAGGLAGAPRAGQGIHVGRDGIPLRITIIPLATHAEPYDPWLALDRPAALVHVSLPGDGTRERVARLAARHGLTPAEAAVAVEIAKGDGRAAVAARLGIRETTVRSHLSSIFDKLGIHRQAELARIAADS